MLSKNKELLARNALPILDSQILDFIKSTDKNNFFSKSLQNVNLLEQFTNYYFNWIKK